MGILIAYLLGLITAVKPKGTDRSHSKPTSDTHDCRSFPGGPISLVCVQPTPSDQERNQAKKKKRRRAVLFWVQVGTLVMLSIYTGITALIWNATNNSVDSSRRQLEMIDRPWIKDNIISAFEMGWQHGSYLGWAVTVRTENVGHSVATGIFPEVKLIAIEGADFLDYPRREAKKVCDDVDGRFEKIKGDPTAWANSIFPGAAADFGGYNVYLLPAEVEKKSFDGGANLGRSINPMLVGCILYHYPSSEHAHHTGFVYQLSHTEDPALAQPTTVFFGIGRNIPKDKIVLVKVGQFTD